MARRYTRDQIGRFSGTSGGGSTAPRSSIKKTGGKLGGDDARADARAAKRETQKLNKEKKAAEAKIGKLKAQAKSKAGASQRVGEIKVKLKEAQQKKKEAGEKAAASRARLVELQKQLDASKARLGGKSTKSGARRK